MIDFQILEWLNLLSSWYILLPLGIVILRWASLDAVRRRVAWYVFFNLGFTLFGSLLVYLDYNNIFIFYLGSPLLLLFIYLIFDILLKEKKVWQYVKWLVISYTLFVAVDMFWIEGFRNFPENIYLIEKAIIVFMAYYFLYFFSKEARQDFSSLWIAVGIGINALLSFIILFYSPHLGLKENTIGAFIWYGLGSSMSIISYSFVAYGLWTAPKILSIKGSKN